MNRMVPILPESFLAIGDVHGDLDALCRALEIARGEKLPPVCFGDIVGGVSDSACIDLLRDYGCLVLRGNHDQWAIERNEMRLAQDKIEWLSTLSFLAENQQTIALHTNYEIESEEGRVLWYELQSSLEVAEVLQRYREKRFVLAAHTHKASISGQQEHDRYISTRRLRAEPFFALGNGRYFIDIGWAQDNVVVFNGSIEPSVRYIFFD